MIDIFFLASLVFWRATAQHSASLEKIISVAGINHIMDMLRTRMNVTGDAPIALALDRMPDDVRQYIPEDDIWRIQIGLGWLTDRSHGGIRIKISSH